MEFEIERRIGDREIVHYADGGLRVTSRHNRIFVDSEGEEWTVDLPAAPWERFAGVSRLGRRALRLDKCNVVPVDAAGEELVIVRRGSVYRYDHSRDRLERTLELEECRNPLHQSIECTDDGRLYFGEYFRNPDRRSVPVYSSRDGGRSWECAHRFEAGEIRHVHGCFRDPVEEEIWVLTGDREGECYMVVADPAFEELERRGDGTQLWRACNVFFEEDAVYWLMDSEVQTSWAVRWDRSTGRTRRLESFPGPIWYSKRLSDGWYVCATTCEEGPSVEDEYAHVFASRDFETWREVARFRHDGWPKGYFKFGVVGFADGEQSSGRFYIFGEGLDGLDGTVAECTLSD